MSRLLFTITLLLFVSKLTVSQPSCLVIIKDLAPCLSYLQGRAASPRCCAGVKGLSGMAKTKEDRTSICECVKKTLSIIKYDPELIPKLPQKCGVNFALPPIDKTYDCSKIPAY